MVRARSAAALLLILAAACAESSSSNGGVPTSDAGDAGEAGDAASTDGGSDVQLGDVSSDAPGCGCSVGIHNTAIVVLSQDAELWTYSPETNQFLELGALPCASSDEPFSLAVDRRGIAWVVFSPDNDIQTFDVNAAGACQDPGYAPNQMGFGLFGMAFSVESAQNTCEKIYLLSYSGSGAFTESPGAGSLGVLDPATGLVTKLSTIDYDGGELAGTGDGRLFAFTGVNPAKLVEYDKATGAPLSIIPLTGFSKTNASAFAFYAGDFYLFTEAPPHGCAPCLTQNCSAAYDACKLDGACADALACALEAGDISDACGGLMPAELQQCVSGTCVNECLPHPTQRVSQVHRFDLDSQSLTLVNPAAPIRIVGADASTCVATQPPR